jgi:hypothetical protein
MVRLRAVFAATTLFSALGLGAGAHGQTCPANLARSVGQIQTPSLQPLLTESLDDRISRFGGLDQTIASSQQTLARLTAFRSKLRPTDDPAMRQAVDETILVVTQRLQALNCRKGV